MCTTCLATTTKLPQRNYLIKLRWGQWEVLEHEFQHIWEWETTGTTDHILLLNGENATHAANSEQKKQRKTGDTALIKGNPLKITAKHEASQNPGPTVDPAQSMCNAPEISGRQLSYPAARSSDGRCDFAEEVDTKSSISRQKERLAWEEHSEND